MWSDSGSSPGLAELVWGESVHPLERPRSKTCSSFARVLAGMSSCVLAEVDPGRLVGRSSDIGWNDVLQDANWIRVAVRRDDRTQSYPLRGTPRAVGRCPRCLCQEIARSLDGQDTEARSRGGRICSRRVSARAFVQGLLEMYGRDSDTGALRSLEYVRMRTRM
jgi:hypothetical protein